LKKVAVKAKFAPTAQRRDIYECAKNAPKQQNLIDLPIRKKLHMHVLIDLAVRFVFFSKTFFDPL
jgi:hypothetical protein